MKKLLLALVIAMAPVAAFSANYGAAGCGLGSMLMGADGNQVLASTTNGTLYSNLFGISTGTANCTDTGSVAKAMDLYIDANRVALASDAARGQGTTIASLSEVMGCRDSAALGQAMQKNYDVLFPSAEVVPADLSSSLRKMRTEDASLAAACAG